MGKDKGVRTRVLGEGRNREREGRNREREGTGGK